MSIVGTIWKGTRLGDEVSIVFKPAGVVDLTRIGSNPYSFTGNYTKSGAFVWSNGTAFLTMPY